MAVTYYRSDQALVTVSCVQVALDKKAWDLFEGGDQTVQGLKVWPGGMKPMVSLGGVAERQDIKVARKWGPYTASIKKALDNVCGDADIQVSITPYESNEKAGPGGTETYTGKLTGVERAKYKSGPSEEVMLTLTITPNGPVK